MITIYSPTLPARTDTDFLKAYVGLNSGETMHVSGGNLAVPDPRGAVESPVNNILWQKHDIAIVGQPGAFVQCPGPGNCLAIENCYNVSMAGITFKSNRTPETGGNGIWSTILLRGNNDHLTFEHLSFMDFGGQAISHLWGKKTSVNVVVSKCSFIGGGSHDVPGLYVDGAAVSGIGSNWRVVQNTVINCTRGFEVESGEPCLIRDVWIKDNLVIGGTDAGVLLSVTHGDGSMFQDIEISFNHIRDFKTVRPKCAQTGIKIGGGTRISVCNNHIDNCGTNGILAVPSQGKLVDLVMANNQVTNCRNPVVTA